jgi:hypothetical protein
MELPPVAAIREELAAKNSSGAYAQQRLVYSTFMDLLPGIRLAEKPAIMGMRRDCGQETQIRTESEQHTGETGRTSCRFRSVHFYGRRKSACIIQFHCLKLPCCLL